MPTQDQFKLSEVAFVKETIANNKNKGEIDIDRCSTLKSHSSEVKHTNQPLLKVEGS